MSFSTWFRERVLRRPKPFDVEEWWRRNHPGVTPSMRGEISDLIQTATARAFRERLYIGQWGGVQEQEEQ